MIKNDVKINVNFKGKDLKALRNELKRTKEELNVIKEKFVLIEKNGSVYSDS